VRVLAADIGGSSIRAALLLDDGKVLERREELTPEDPAEGYALLRGLWLELGPADATALVVAGGIRKTTGEITQSPNLLRYEGTRPGEELGCEVLNDANGALLGEAWLGALKEVRTAVLLTLGTGVGGAVMLDGRLWTGTTGSAGEIGHVCVHPEGPPCPCGGRGCLELYASASAVARAADTKDAKEAAERARRKQPQAQVAFETAGESLGIALASVVNVLNPEAICIGGGMVGALDLFEDALRTELTRRAFRLATERLEIVPAALGGDAGLYGAASLALQRGK
jgi:glucokinase